MSPFEVVFFFFSFWVVRVQDLRELGSITDLRNDGKERA